MALDRTPTPPPEPTATEYDEAAPELAVLPAPPDGSAPARAALHPEASTERTQQNQAALRQLAQGDRRGAIATLMSAHEDMIFAYCVRMLRDPSAAEDVMQQVFLEAYRDLDQFRGQSSLGTWLYSIAGHRCSDQLKAAQRRAGRLVDDEAGIADHADPGAAADDRLDQARLVDALGQCLQCLGADTRAAVLLRFQAGMSYEAMALALETKADTLSKRVVRALPLLKECLERKGWRHG